MLNSVNEYRIRSLETVVIYLLDQLRGTLDADLPPVLDIPALGRLADRLIASEGEPGNDA